MVRNTLTRTRTLGTQGVQHRHSNHRRVPCEKRRAMWELPGGNGDDRQGALQFPFKTKQNKMTKNAMLSLNVRIARADSLTPAAAFALCFYRRWHVDVRAIRFGRIQVGFKMFLGVTVTCSNWSTDASGNASECSLVSRPRHSSISQPVRHVRAPQRSAVPPVALRADTRCMYSLHV